MNTDKAGPTACICATWLEETPFGFEAATGPDATCPIHGEKTAPADALPGPRNALIMLLHYYGLAFNAHTKQPTADTQAALTEATRMVHTHVEAEAGRAAAAQRALGGALASADKTKTSNEED